MIIVRVVVHNVSGAGNKYEGDLLSEGERPLSLKVTYRDKVKGTYPWLH